MSDNDIILISDPKVLAVPIKENGDALADLKDFPDIKIDARRSSASNSFSHLRISLAYKLLKVQGRLPDTLRLLIIEGHRPLSFQKELFDGYSVELKELHPEWNEKRIYAESSKFVAPPEIIPPHSTGGAIDLTLCDEEGREIDMGTEINADPEESKNACFTSADNISDEAKANRKILIDAMTSVGFINYPTEWWHWSYGDRYWAYTTKEDYALFDSIG